ncbi:MAG TPA: hypothetical protein VKA46_33950 [Gemmataceae bacterium]|nr:hypothetical protein [Gemmataceae bacterium]
MQGREFLELARELLASGTAPRHWRAVIIHAYYALFLECREAMSRWGLPPLPRLQAHSEVRLRLTYSSDSDLKEIGNKLERLGKRRNWASYDLQSLPVFASPAQARQDVKDATTALALLDAIDADPARRAAAVASIPP